jgi:hypothetical protein
MVRPSHRRRRRRPEARPLLARHRRSDHRQAQAAQARVAARRRARGQARRCQDDDARGLRRPLDRGPQSRGGCQRSRRGAAATRLHPPRARRVRLGRRLDRVDPGCDRSGWRAREPCDGHQDPRHRGSDAGRSEAEQARVDERGRGHEGQEVEGRAAQEAQGHPHRRRARRLLGVSAWLSRVEAARCCSADAGRHEDERPRRVAVEQRGSRGVRLGHRPPAQDGDRATLRAPRGRRRSAAARLRRDLRRALDWQRAEEARERGIPLDAVPAPRAELFTDTDKTLRVDFHSFRRAFCTGLARAGVSMQQADALSN